MGTFAKKKTTRGTMHMTGTTHRGSRHHRVGITNTSTFLLYLDRHLRCVVSDFISTRGHFRHSWRGSDHIGVSFPPRQDTRTGHGVSSTYRQLRGFVRNRTHSRPLWSNGLCLTNCEASFSQPARGWGLQFVLLCLRQYLI